MRPGAVKQALVIAIVLLVCLVAVLTLGQTILAQSGGQYDLSWTAIVGGGQINSSGGNYVLGGSAGQPGVGSVTGGKYRLEGGFWQCFPLASAECQIAAGDSANFLPIIIGPNN